jgi:hypothetical protein
MDQTNGPNHREDAVEKKTTGQENKTTSPVGPEHRAPPHTDLDLETNPGTLDPDLPGRHRRR